MIIHVFPFDSFVSVVSQIICVYLSLSGSMFIRDIRSGSKIESKVLLMRPKRRNCFLLISLFSRSVFIALADSSGFLLVPFGNPIYRFLLEAPFLKKTKTKTTLILCYVSMEQFVFYMRNKWL